MDTTSHPITLDYIRRSKARCKMRPELKHLSELVTPAYGAQWKFIGKSLGFENGVLEIINCDFQTTEKCCNDLWDRWLDTFPTATWAELLFIIDTKCFCFLSISSLPEAVANLENALKQLHTGTRYKTSEDEWPPYQPKHFNSVALFHHKDKLVTREQLVALARVQKSGNVDGYEHTKEVREIFLPTEVEGSVTTPPSTILIEGAPGIGKTFLCKEIAYQWANGNLLTDKRLLFLVYLRDPKVQKIRHFGDFIEYISSSNVSAFATEFISNMSGKDIAIVLDGYDELPLALRQRSFLADLINGRSVHLTKCTVVVTSRPSASACLHNNVDRRIEVLGFSEESRVEYILHTFKGEDEKIAFMLDFLKKHSAINAFCYIPLNMTILCCLFLERSTDLPKTQTELNHKFICITILRFLRKTSDTTYNFSILSDLCAPHRQILNELAMLAFTRLQEDSIVFTKKEIKPLCPHLTLHEQNWSGLGLLKAVSFFSFEQGTSIVSYNFLHFSIQEFLAAYHVSMLHEDTQIVLLDKTFWVSDFLNMWVMYVGLTKGKSFPFAHFLSGNTFVWQSRLIGTTGISNSIIQSKVKRLQLFQCFSEAEDDVMCKQVGELLKDGNIDLSGQALLGKDLHTLSLFLARSTTKVWTTVNLSMCSIGDDGIKNLLKSFSNDCKSNTVIKILDLSCNGISSSSVTELAKLILSWNICTLKITANKLQEDIYALAKALQDNCDSGKIVHLDVAQHYIMIACLAKYSEIKREFDSCCFTGLYLLKCNFTEDVFGAIEWLHSFSKSHKPHVIMYLCDNAIPFPLVTNYLLLPVHPYSHCKMLLQDFGVSAAMVAAAIEKLTVTCKLAVQLGDNPLPIHICNVNNNKDNNICESLIQHCHKGTICVKGCLKSEWVTHWLSKLHLRRNFNVFHLKGLCSIGNFADNLSAVIGYSNMFSCLRLDTCDLKEVELTSIFRALKEKSSTLKRIEFSQIAIYGKAATKLASLISVSNALEYLNLSGCTVAEKDLTIIMAAMKDCKGLIYLDLSHNCITEQVSKAIAKYSIGNKSKLQHLYLSNCNLTEEGISVLAQSLQKVKKLQTLDFSGNVITATGAMNIATVLDSYSNLQTLLLSNCELCSVCIKPILHELLTKENLRQVDFGCNVINNNDSLNIAALVSNNPHLEHVDLSDCDLPTPTLIHITEMLAKNSCLKFLVLSGHKFTEVVSTNFALLVYQNVNLEHLSLSNCSIKDIKCFKSLQNLKSLRSLDFSFNVLNDEAAVTVAKVISNNASLSCMSLSKCALTDFGLMEILKSMKKHSYITNVDLSYNNGNYEVMLALAAVIYESNNLKTLCISNCNLQQEGFWAIIKALQQTVSLKYLDLNGNAVTNKVGNELVNLLSVTNTLEYANLSNCQLKEKMVLRICATLSNMTSLKCLNLGGCKLNSEAVSTIRNIIEQNVFLEHLILPKCCIECSQLISMLVVRPEAMKHISFGFNLSSSQPGATTISDGKCKLTRIEFIDFSSCNLQRAEISTICKIISTTRTLRHLNLSDNVGVAAETVAALTKIISKNVYLQHFDVSNCLIQNEDLKTIFRAFKYHVFLKFLDLRSSHVTDDVAVDVTTVIANNFALKHLKLSHISLHEKGFKVLIKYLNKVKCLQQLCLNQVDIADSEANVIADCIRQNDNISHLNMSACNISEAGISSILIELANMQSLKQFKLNDIIISDSSADRLCNVIDNQMELIHIEIARCKLQDTCFQKLMDVLPNSLKHLDVSGNFISDNVALNVASYLMGTFTITHFDLSKCALTEKGAQLVFGSLQSCDSLKYFDVSCNALSNEVSQTLSKVLCSNVALQFLNMCDCKLTETGSYFVVEALKGTTSLNHIDLRNNNIGFQSAITLAEVLIGNSQLECVMLEGTSLTEDGTASICKGLKDSRELRHLDLSCTNISDKTVTLFTSLFMNNKKMMYFGLPFTSLSDAALAIVLHSIATNVSVLETLNLSTCTINDTLANSLEAAIASNTMLKLLNLNKIYLSQKGFDILQQCFSIMYNLNSIVFDSVSLTASSVQSLASSLTNNSNLQFFNLENCTVAAGVLDIITNSLKRVRALQYLNLNFVPISDGDEVGIAAVIANNTNLEHLELAGCNISEAAIVKIFEALATNNNHLQCLNLSSNSISHHVSMCLGKLLERSMITNLMISKTQLQEEGFTAILNSVRNGPIHCIDLSFNKITYKSACCIADMTTSTSLLEQVDLSGCVLEKTAAAKIASAFKDLTSLKHLSMKFDSDDTAQEIAGVILNNSELEYLNLASCNLQKEGLLAVLNASSKITTLKHLSVNITCISTSITKAVLNTLCRNSYLEHFELYGEIPEEDMISIVKAFQDNISLKFFKTTSSSITNRVAHEVANFLHTNPAVEYLLMPQCTLQKEGIKEIAMALRNLTNCKVIDFRSTFLTDPAVVKNIPSLFNSNTYLQLFHAKAIFLFETEFYMLHSNLRKFASLEFLYIERCVVSNEVATILTHVVSSNTNLRGLSLAYCDIPETELENIFSMLNGLQYLNINNIKMRNLIKEFAAMISKSVKLTHLEIAGCVLSCASTQLFEIVSAKLTSLKHVNFSHNTITSIAAKHIVSICNCNNDLERFELAHCLINEKELSTIVYCLKEQKKLKYMDLRFHYFTRETSVKLVHLILSCSLETLKLAGVHTEINDFVKVTFALAKMTSLVYLDLSYSYFNDEAVLNIANVIANNTHLRELKLSDCEFSIKGLKEIVAILQKKFCHLSCLDLSFTITNTKVLIDLLPLLQCVTDIMPWNVLILSELKRKDFQMSTMLNNMKQHCTMKHFELIFDNCPKEVVYLTVGIVNKNADFSVLNLSGCWLRLGSISLILSRLKCVASLRHIDLSSNHIGEQPIEQLCELLHSSVDLEHLNLSNCKVKASGLLKIAHKLKYKTSLRYLNVSFNDVHFLVTLDVLNIISSNSAITLSHLNISNCRLHQKEEKVFTDHLQITTLNHLDFSYNVISSQAAFAIGNIIANNIDIQYLNMSGLLVQDDDFSQILDAWRRPNYCNISLNHIDLSENTLTEDMSNGLAMVLSSNKITLKHLSLKNCKILGGIGNIFEALTLVTSLEYLSLSRITITDRLENKLAIAVSNSTNLRLLDLCDCKLSQEFIAQKLSTVCNIKYLSILLEHLNISKNYISSGSCIKLTNSLHAVEVLQLSGSFTDPAKFSTNLIALQSVSTLTYLNLSGNDSGSHVEGLIQLVSNNASLQHIDLSKCKIDQTGIKILFDILGVKNSLRHLDISNNNISVQNPNATVPSIENSLLAYLNLSNCNLCEEEVLAVSHVVSKCSHLKYINLSSSRISNEAAIYVASLVEYSKLQSVHLPDCRLEDDGVKAIFQAIVNFSARNVTEIDLSCQLLSEYVTRCIALAITQAPYLTYLNLSNCGLREHPQVTKILNALENVKVLKTLDFSYNDFPQHSTSILRDCVALQQWLYELNLNNCKLSFYQVSEVLDAIMDKTSLCCLNIGGNKIDVAVADKIATLISNNKSLKELILASCEMQEDSAITIVTSALNVANLQVVDISFNPIEHTVDHLSELVAPHKHMMLKRNSLQNELKLVAKY